MKKNKNIFNFSIFDKSNEKMLNLLLVVALIIFVVWILGLVTAITFNGGIHVLLAIGIILFIVWLIAGRRR